MRRPAAAVVALIVVLAPACGTGTGRTRARRAVTAAVRRVADRPYTFEYVESLAGTKSTLRVRGRVEDDLRSHVTLAVGGKDVMQQIISDDAIAVRIVDQNKAAPYVAAVTKKDKTAGAALKGGKWVIDHQGAPDLIAARTSENSVRVGVNPMLDATGYLFQYIEDAMNDASSRQSPGVEEFNADDIDYNPLDDPWKADAEADLVDQGIRRYDLAQPPLPRRTQRGTEAAIGDVKHFRKMAFYLRGTRLETVKEQIDIRDRPEFRRAAAGRAATYYLRFLAQSLAGATREPVRERTMEMSFRARDDVRVALPASNFVGVQPIDLVSDVALIVPQSKTGSSNAP